MLRFSQWMDGEGPESDIVLSSRIRLARNLQGFPFPHRMAQDQALSELDRVRGAVERLEPEWGLRFSLLGEMSALERQVLMEKHLVSPLLVQDPIHWQAVAVDPSEHVSLMVNEEDHMRLQVLLPALQLENAWQVANQMDDELEESLDYSFDAHSGYLTACPTNLGTALRASVMVHLPALVMTRQAPQIFTTLAQVGMVVRGLYGEGSEAYGNLFQVSNQVSLGLSEEEFIHNLSMVVRQLVDRERAARHHLLQQARLQLADRVGRAWGILTNAKIMSSDEALRLLSEVRLGEDLDLLVEPQGNTFAQLILLTRPGFLQVVAETPLSPGQRDQLRAETLRTHLIGKE